MSRGRKPAKVNFGSDWKEIFRSSVGYYFQSIIVELASRSILENGFDSNIKLKPKNALPKIEESEKPFEIPKSWNWYRLGELCNYGSSSKAEPKNLNDSTWVLDLEDIEKESSVLLAKIRFAERNSLSTKSVFKKGDVLYSKLRPYLDKVIVADEDGVCTTEILPLSISEEINPNFLLLTLKLRSFLSYVNGVTKGMKMPRLGTKEGKMALIPLPSLSEQNKILNFLADLENNSLKTDGFYFGEEAERKIVNLQYSQLQGSQISTELNHQLALVKELRQAYLREAMQGKLAPQDSTDEPAEILLEKIRAEKEKLVSEKKIKQGKIQEPEKQEVLFDIPSNWIWCLLDDISIYITDGTHQTPNYTQSGRVFLSAQNIKPFKFMPEAHRFVSEEAYQDYIRNRKAEKGDLLVARVGAGIGEAAVIDKDIDFAFYVSLGLVKPFQKFLNSDYMAIVLNSPFGVNYAKGNISSKGGSAGNFNLGRIRSFPFPLPPLAEQERIVAKLEKLMKFCDELEANIRQGIKNADQLLQTALKEALEPKRL